MKKFFLSTLLLFIFIINLSIKAQSVDISSQIYVHDIILNKIQYNIGDTVQGQFSISNLSDISQSDIYYTISTGLFLEGENKVDGEYGLSNKKGPIYIKNKSKENLSFVYNLPNTLSGNSAIKINAFLQDGTFIGQSYYQIYIKGDSYKKIIKILDSNLSILSNIDNKNNNEIISNILTTSGPTIYEGEKLSYNFYLSTTTKEYEIIPVLKIYNRVDNEDNLKKEIKLDPIKTSSDFKKYSISIPTDLDPAVYYGVINFESNDIEISPEYFRYIKAGPIATIRNITSEKLQLKKDENFTINVLYGGQPVDEFRPEKQIKPVDVNLYIKAINEKGELIDEINQPIDLYSDSRSISLNMKSKIKASSIILNAFLKDKNGKILSEYRLELPNNEKVKNQYSYIKHKNQYMYIYLFVIYILLLLIILKINKNRLSKLRKIILIIILSIIFIFLSFKDIKAWTMEGGHIYTAENLFKLTSVISPLPPEIKTYEPDEVFDLSISASYGDCTNSSQYFYAYMYNPSIEWWKEIPIFKVTNDWYGDYIYNKKYWNDLVLASKAMELFTSSGLSNKLGGVNGNKTICQSSGGVWAGGICIFNKYDDKRFSFSKTYKAPKTPGFHKIYFSMFQIGDDKGGNGINDGTQNALYSQNICVRGAGVCPNEDIALPIITLYVDKITSNQANINWTYQDKNNLPQKDYQIQISTDVNFSNIINSLTSYDNSSNDISSIRSVVLNNLNASTTYYVRLKVSNTDNKWSEFKKTTFVTLSDKVNKTCSCNNTRTLTCVNEGLITEQKNAVECNFKPFCSYINDNDNVIFTITPINGIGSITYVKDGIADVKTDLTPKKYIVKDIGQSQTIKVDVTDNFDGKNVILNCQNISVSTTTNSEINNPSISLNKNNRCDLTWDIKYMPENTTCILNGLYASKDPIPYSGSFKPKELNSNQRYTIKCFGPNLSSEISDSVICRIDPSIREN